MLSAPDLFKTAPVREKRDCFVAKLLCDCISVYLYCFIPTLYAVWSVMDLFSNLGFLLISHVQSMVEIKTDIGHARAWIR